MKKLKRVLIWIGGIILTVYMGICFYYYFVQEKMLFNPGKLPSDYQFQFDCKFEELTINTADGTKLNGLLFRADSSKGLIFFLHGSSGNLQRYNEDVLTYTQMHYDMFILDYRGYGKSEGKIKSEKQFFNDISDAYVMMKERYSEKNIVIMGLSIGTGPAAMLASKNNPKLLILLSPYYSILEEANNKLPFLPISFFLKYKFETYKYVKETKAPIVIFHGNKDNTFDYSVSGRLKTYFKLGDQLFILNGHGHGGFTSNNQYKEELIKLLQ